MSVANQKIVQIAPRTKRDSEHLFAMMNIDALQMAMQELKGSALKMWLYFNKNQERYKNKELILEFLVEKLKDIIQKYRSSNNDKKYSVTF